MPPRYAQRAVSIESKRHGGKGGVHEHWGTPSLQIGRRVLETRLAGPVLSLPLIERSVILTTGSTLNVTVPESVEKTVANSPHLRSSNTSQAAERARIIKALEEAKGQVGGPDGAAARLGLKRTTLQSRMREFNIARQYH